jgi:hypothetical protein
MNFEKSYFKKHVFTTQQKMQFYNNAKRDIKIAESVSFNEVQFNYCFSALIKAGIALLSSYNVKIKSTAGHHIKILEKMSEILDDPLIYDIGNIMRAKRNLDFYDGGAVVTAKECNEYFIFVKDVIKKIKNKLQQ